MGKSLSERIVARHLKGRPRAGVVNKAAMLALHDEIKAALADGWAITLVWETLRAEGKISFSYTAFHRHVTRVQSLQLARASTTIRAKRALKPAPGPAPTRTSTKRQEVRAGFTFNAVPNIEELL